MKVLVSAYACEPWRGSEPEVGWQWVHQIARFHETWVITRESNREDIEAGLLKEPQPNLHFEHIDLPPKARFWKKGNRGVHAYYYIWQMMAAKRAHALNKKIQFDLAHHITFVNDWIGPGISTLDVPFIWGPIGANPYIPLRFLSLLGARGEMRNLLRLAMRLSAPFRDPLYFTGLTRAKKIIVTNREIQNRFPETLRDKTTILPQNSVSEEILVSAPKTKPSRRFKILSAGQFVPIKAFPLTLKAFARHLETHPSSHLTLAGDGKQRRYLEDLTKRLGIENSVEFAGFLKRDTLLNRMGDCDAFLFPSFEGAGMVVLEAMAKAMPVVCLDFGGPGNYIGEDGGIKIPLSSPAKMTDGLAGALDKLADDTDLFQRCSQSALRRIREGYLWDSIGERLESIYAEILSQREGIR